MSEISSEKVSQKKFAFVMELQAGMRTQYMTWRDTVSQMPDISPTWVPISYYEPNGLIEKLKFVPGSIRAAARSYRQVEAGLGKTRYDAVLFNTYNPAVIHARSVREQRAFLMFDVTPKQYDGMAHWYSQMPDKPGSRFAEFKHRRVCTAFQGAAGLMAWSNWAAQSAIEDYGAEPNKIQLVPPGVDPNHWRPGEESNRPDDGITRILFTGYDFRRKGGDLLVQWAKRTTRRDWELHLVTHGDVGDLTGLTDRIVVHREMGTNAPDFVRLAQCCDLFILPTRADCFSIASLEAMATGMPVITCDVGGISDIILEGETGYLIAPDDYDALHDRIETLLDSPELRNEMGRRGRERVIEHFDATSLVRRGIKGMMPK